jgi:hypothetical protein
MTTLMLLFAPVVVLIAALIMNAAEKQRHSLSNIHLEERDERERHSCSDI